MQLKTCIIGTSSPITRPNLRVLSLSRECNATRDYTRAYDRDRVRDRDYDRDHGYHREHHQVLDVGCGYGRHLFFPVTVGLDADLKVLKTAKRRAPCVCGDGQNLPFRSGVFDLALFAFSLEYMKDPDRARREGLRVARDLFELSYPGRYTWDIVTGQGRQS